MMSRFNDIAQIYDYKLSQLRDPQVWQNTLKLTSNFWRLNFCAAMLLTEQNPKAVIPVLQRSVCSFMAILR